VAAVWDLSIYDLHVPAQRSGGFPVTNTTEDQKWAELRKKLAIKLGIAKPTK
jgi:hypothetical protein